MEWRNDTNYVQRYTARIAHVHTHSRCSLHTALICLLLWLKLKVVSASFIPSSTHHESSSCAALHFEDLFHRRLPCSYLPQRPDLTCCPRLHLHLEKIHGRMAVPPNTTPPQTTRNGMCDDRRRLFRYFHGREIVHVCQNGALELTSYLTGCICAHRSVVPALTDHKANNADAELFLHGNREASKATVFRILF